MHACTKLKQWKVKFLVYEFDFEVESSQFFKVQLGYSLCLDEINKIEL